MLDKLGYVGILKGSPILDPFASPNIAKNERECPKLGKSLPTGSGVHPAIDCCGINLKQNKMMKCHNGDA